jgi:hypothetical protein
MKELWEVGRDGLWTEDDTYDYCSDVIVMAMKTLKIKIREDYFEEIDFLKNLQGSINSEVSSALYGCLEEEGDPWGFDNEREPTGRLKKRTMKALMRVLKRELKDAIKLLKMHKEKLDFVVGLIATRNKYMNQYNQHYDAKWYKNAIKKNNYVPKSLLHLRNLAYKFLNHLDIEIRNCIPVKEE